MTFNISSFHLNRIARGRFFARRFARLRFSSEYQRVLYEYMPYTLTTELIIFQDSSYSETIGGKPPVYVLSSIVNSITLII